MPIPLHLEEQGESPFLVRVGVLSANGAVVGSSRGLRRLPRIAVEQNPPPSHCRVLGSLSGQTLFTEQHFGGAFGTTLPFRLNQERAAVPGQLPGLPAGRQALENQDRNFSAEACKI